MYRLIRLSMCAFLGLVSSVISAQATTITTPSYTGWTSSSFTVAASQYEGNFNMMLQGYTSFTMTAPGPETGFVITGPDGATNHLTGLNFQGVRSLEGGSDSVATMLITLPSGNNNSFLLGLATADSSGNATNQAITVALSDGETLTSSAGLFGFSLSSPINTITLSTVAGSHIVLQDFWYAQSALTQDGGSTQPPQAAEGATVFLTLGGLCILFGAGRRLMPKPAV